MTPEILTAIRVFLTAAGGWVVGRFGFDNELVVSGIGLIMVALPAVWGIWFSNRPNSGEAVKIAERVAESDAPRAAHIAIAGHVPPGQVERRNL